MVAATHWSALTSLSLLWWVHREDRHSERHRCVINCSHACTPHHIMWRCLLWCFCRTGRRWLMIGCSEGCAASSWADLCDFSSGPSSVSDHHALKLLLLRYKCNVNKRSCDVFIACKLLLKATCSVLLQVEVVSKRWCDGELWLRVMSRDWRITITEVGHCVGPTLHFRLTPFLIISVFRRSRRVFDVS